MYRYLLLILTFGTLLSCSEKASQPSEIDKDPTLFESTGTVRGDFRNFVSFVNKYHGKSEDIINSLGDYVTLTESIVYQCGKRDVLRDTYTGTIGSFPKFKIIVWNGRIYHFDLGLPDGVTPDMIRPYFNNNILPSLKKTSYLGGDAGFYKVHVPSRYAKEDNQRGGCGTLWYR